MAASVFREITLQLAAYERCVLVWTDLSLTGDGTQKQLPLL